MFSYIIPNVPLSLHAMGVTYVRSTMGKGLQMQWAETTHVRRTSCLFQQPCTSMVPLEERTKVGPLKKALGASKTG